MKVREPILGKREPRVNDYRELTFKDFILIQQRAQEVANNIGFPVYLVGSAQTKHLPRDIDISIIIPNDEYTKRYEVDNMEYRGASMMELAFHKEFEHIEPLSRLNFEGYELDLKLCSDSWYIDKEKTLLARPIEEEI